MDTSLLHEIMRETARSLCHSLDMYWPSDLKSRNDMNERMLSMHFAHVMLSRGFGVFAEAHYPNFRQGMSFLDILAISPTSEYFLACEFKKHGKGDGLSASLDDVVRITAFDLHRGLTEPVWTRQRVEVSMNCRTGFGIVGGLKWSGQYGVPPHVDGPGSQQLILKLASIGGSISESIFVRGREGVGAYYLQYASFPIPKRDC